MFSLSLSPASLPQSSPLPTFVNWSQSWTFSFFFNPFSTSFLFICCSCSWHNFSHQTRWPIEFANLSEQFQRFHYLHLYRDESTVKFYFLCVCWGSELKSWCCIALSQVLALISEDKKQQNIGFFLKTTQHEEV